MEIKITIEAAELASAIRQLAEAIGGKSAQAPTHSPELLSQPVAPQALAPTPQPATQSQALAPTPQPAVPAAPVSTAPTYTLEQLSVASMQLMDTGRQPELMALLSKYGAPALTLLSKDAYGAFATDLRQLGVKL